MRGRGGLSERLKRRSLSPNRETSIELLRRSMEANSIKPVPRSLEELYERLRTRGREVYSSTRAS